MIQTIWVAPYLKEDTDIDGNTISIYDTPFKLDVSVNSLSGSTEFMEYGERVKRMCKSMPSIIYIDKIKEKDKAYLYGVTPSGELRNAENANYRVDAVLPQGVKMIIYFEKLS